MADDLRWIGLHDNKIEETLKNANLTKLLIEIVQLAKKNLISNANIDKQKGNFLYKLGTTIKPQCLKFLSFIIKYILNEGIRNDAQLSAALSYLLQKSTEISIDQIDFEKNCGIGVIVTIEEIEDIVKNVIKKHENDIIQQRYSFNVGKLLGEIRQKLPWADGALVKNQVDLEIVILLGAKTEADLECNKTKKKSQKDKETKTDVIKLEEKNDLCGKIAKLEVETIDELLKNSNLFHNVGENYKTDGYIVTPNTMNLLKKHYKAIDGKVVTRFPPEPNGVLHIGHAKAININFGLAKVMNGKCILRYDDTNPEKEEEKFFNAIKEMVEWLGYKPDKITYSSDYFDQLYTWAIKLIKNGNAYVCHQKVEDIRGFDVKPSPWRERPIEESLQLFNQMKNGLIDEGEATLRLKTTLEEGKLDPVAYRIKFLPHHRTKDKWCIYPTYDYTHCLCDSIENITHSLCTKEFQSRRSSYYWLCNALDIYCPVQWEYSRLSIENVLLSKRKILKLIEKNIVNDWDDPRLFTLTGLRRRGVPPEAINNFVAKLGLTVSQATIKPNLFEAVVRDYLNVHAPRVMAVLEPLCVKIINYKDLNFTENYSIDVPLYPTEIMPNNKSKTNRIAFDSTIYIEKTDFEENSKSNFRRLTKTQSVGLKHIGLVLHYDSHEEENKKITLINVKAFKLTEDVPKPKAFIHWVSKPVNCEARSFKQLEINVENEKDELCVPPFELYNHALIDASISNSKISSYYQFERIGFFAIDFKDSKEKLMFNQIVSLKDNSKKEV